MRLVLASTSPYRRQLLERLGLPFEVFRPEVDETPRAGEDPGTLARRLAEAKAVAALGRFEDGWVIGSDQVVAIEDRILGKPGDRDRAVEQLKALAGREVHFLTAVALLELGSGRIHSDLATTTVRFRQLDESTIHAYLEREPAYDCAGGFKSEGLGITLVESIADDDPTALIGLPLIRLCRMLRRAGFAV